MSKKIGRNTNKEKHLDALLMSAVVEVEVSSGQVLDGHKSISNTDAAVIECCSSLHYLWEEILNLKQSCEFELSKVLEIFFFLKTLSLMF